LPRRIAAAEHPLPRWRLKPIAVHTGHGWQSIPAGPRRKISEEGGIEGGNNGNAQGPGNLERSQRRAVMQWSQRRELGQGPENVIIHPNGSSEAIATVDHTVGHGLRPRWECGQHARNRSLVPEFHGN